MAASRDLSFPLVIVCLVLIFTRGYSPLPTTPQVTGTYPPIPSNTDENSFDIFGLSTEDYDRLEDTVTTTSPKQVSPHEGIPKRCNYNRCLEGQIPCAQLAAATGCQCPGITLNNEAPQAPDLKSVSWNGSEVTLHWCAPYSYVTAYNVTIGGKEWRTFGREQRSGAVGNIDHITQVCVIAVNDRGNSSGSCMMYHPRDNSLALKAGLIAGALGFLLLLLLGVLLWRHKRQRKHGASISVDNTAETQ